MSYKAKKESLKAQLRSKQTDWVNQLAESLGLDGFSVFEKMKIELSRQSEKFQRDETSSDDDTDNELPTAISKLINVQPLTATFKYLLQHIQRLHKLHKDHQMQKQRRKDSKEPLKNRGMQIND